jgi:replicative DNA helicase
MSVETGINLQSVRLWAVNENELPAYMQAFSDLHSLPLYIDDEGGLTVTDLRNRVLRHIAQQGPLDLLIIDYLQLLGAPSSSGRRYETRTQGVSLPRDRAFSAFARGRGSLQSRTDAQ